MGKLRLPWSDALRILRKRQELVRDLKEAELKDSIHAFLAWKAFAIVARGTTPEAREKNQCQELMRLALPAAPEMKEPARLFVRGLEGLVSQSPALMEAWYCEEDWAIEEKQRRTTDAKRRVRRLAPKVHAGDLDDPETAYDIGENMYSVRSAVIAHASVHTGGNLFPHIVVPFGKLAAMTACVGIALRAEVPLQIVLSEADAPRPA